MGIERNKDAFVDEFSTESLVFLGRAIAKMELIGLAEFDGILDPLDQALVVRPLAEAFVDLLHIEIGSL